MAANPFAVENQTKRAPDLPVARVAVEQERAVAETQAAMTIAKRFPRDQKEAVDQILVACGRPTLALAATYNYAKGGTDIAGASIRLAECIAQQWGNLQFGIREVEQRDGFSVVEAFAWDVQTNTRQIKEFHVKHHRDTKSGGYALTGSRDIYELVANQGARRLRACILGIIPGDVVEAALDQCKKTLQAAIEVTPELLKSLEEKFSKFGVTMAMIEARIQRRAEAMTPGQAIQLGNIYNSLVDQMGTPGDWFDMEAGKSEGAVGEVIQTLNKTPETAKEATTEKSGQAPAVRKKAFDASQDEPVVPGVKDHNPGADPADIARERAIDESPGGPDEVEEEEPDDAAKNAKFMALTRCKTYPDGMPIKAFQGGRKKTFEAFSEQIGALCLDFPLWARAIINEKFKASKWAAEWTRMVIGWMNPERQETEEPELEKGDKAPAGFIDCPEKQGRIAFYQCEVEPCEQLNTCEERKAVIAARSGSKSGSRGF